MSHAFYLIASEPTEKAYKIREFFDTSVEKIKIYNNRRIEDSKNTWRFFRLFACLRTGESHKSEIKIKLAIIFNCGTKILKFFSKLVVPIVTSHCKHTESNH